MLWLIAIISFVAFLIVKQNSRRSKLPCGPTPIPLLGNLPHLAWYITKTGGLVSALRLFEKKYGKVFTLWLGPQPTVHIADIELAQEMMVKQGGKFVDRSVPDIFSEGRDGYGLIFSNGGVWQDHRRFALHTLRNFGLGRNIMEHRIIEEINARFSEIERDLKGGQAVRDISNFFDLVVGSIINSMLFSTRFEENDPEFEKLKTMLSESLETSTVFDTVVPIWVLRLPILRKRLDQIMGPTVGILEFVRKQVRERQEAIKCGKHELHDDPEDFVDAFLLKIKQDEKSGVTSNFNLDSLAVDLLDLWSAGQETTSTTLMWGTVLLLNNPANIAKIRDEVRSVTDDGERHLSLADKARTPFLNAAINEIQRHASILNINLWRKLSEDVVIDGQPVEAGTSITAQLSLLMTEESVFKDYKKFDPTRYLNDSKQQQSVVPFGIGKRACLGESLARAELYLILGNLLLRYDLRPSGDLPDPSSLTPLGVLNRPKKCKVQIIRL